jgi:F-type H+-transporting ATPase subunit gamma
MKMIASTKLAKAQRAMRAGKEYGLANKGQFCQNVPLLQDYFLNFYCQTEVFAHVPSDKPTPNKLFIVISSDKGLCGGIHSSVSKATRRALKNAPDSPLTGASANDSTVDASSPIMVIGDKSKAQLSRALPSNMQLTFNQIGRDIPTFADAAGVADLIAQSGVKYDSVVLVYNKFLSTIAYEAASVEVKGEEALKESGAFDFFK